MCLVGLEKEEIDTPALLIDLDVMEKNILTMANFLKRKKPKLRAHTKVHRTPIIAHKQLDAGAKGICCQKVGEAEVMAAGGINDILVSNEVVSPSKIKRLVALNKYADVSVAVDNADVANAFSRAALRTGVELKTFVDVHMGSGRCGVEPGNSAIKLAMHIDSLDSLKFMGLMGFEGHLSHMEPREERRKEIKEHENKLIETKKLIEKEGLKVAEISTGSTGTYDVSALIPNVTEIQAGSYLLMDASYHPHVPEFECALTVLSTVMSKPSDDRAITDAGRMSISAHSGNPLVVGSDLIEVTGVSAEHTLLKMEKSVKIKIGDKIELIPPYLDGTVKLHQNFYAIRNGEIEAVWKILGRDSSK